MDERDAKTYLRENAALRKALGVPDGAVLDPHFLGVGEHNLNFSFTDPSTGRAYVLRVNVATQPFHKDQVAYEFGALRALEPSGRVPQALYLDNTASAPCKGVLVIGYCDGDELDFDALRPGDLRCAAQLMADVHAVPVDDRCPVFRPRDPLRALFEECLQRFDIYRGSAAEDARVTEWVASFIALAEPLVQAALPAADCGHIVNTEPLPSHFLIPAESTAEAAASEAGRFCTHPGSFIDWERPIVGEVAQDVAYFTSPTTTFWDSDHRFPVGEVATFVEDYWRAVDGRFGRGAFDARFGAYYVVTALRSMTWCCRAVAQGTPLSKKAARKVPVYLSDDFMESTWEAVLAFT